MKVGDKVWYVRPYSGERNLIETEVIKVGRDYFYTSDRMKVNILTKAVSGEYGYHFRVYLSKEEYETEVRIKSLVSYIQKFFGAFGNVSELNEQELNAIYDIIKNKS